MMGLGRATLDRRTIGALIAGTVASVAACSDDGTGPGSGPDVASVSVIATGSTTLGALDATVQLQASALDAGGSLLSGVTFAWSSSASDVASVDANGLVTAHGNGQADISAEAGDAEGTITVTVEQVATHIAFSAPPTNSSVGVPFAQLAVQVTDANGRVATNYTTPVTIAIGKNPLGGALTGQFTRNPVAGVVAFPGLALDEPGAGYTLLAHSEKLIVESDLFNVTRRAVYIAQGGPGQNIAFVDLGADTLGSVEIGRGPVSVAITPDGLHLYVVNRTADSIAVMETPGHTVVAMMPIGDLTQFVRISPDGSVAYATSSNDGNMAAISTASNTVVETVDLGAFPVGLAFTPNSQYAYVAVRGDDSVAVVSTATHTVVQRIAAGNGPLDVAVSPDGSLVYVTNNDGGNVTLISTATNAVVGSVPVGAGPAHIAFTPDGSAAFVANEDENTVSRIDTSTNTAPTTIPVGDRPISVAVTPDGQYVYVGNVLDSTVSVIDVATNTVVDTFPVPQPPLDFAFVPLPVP